MGAQVEGNGQRIERGQRGALQAALQLRDIGAMKISSICEFLLRDRYSVTLFS
jgi:hypothetical protein